MNPLKDQITDVPEQMVNTTNVMVEDVVPMGLFVIHDEKIPFGSEISGTEKFLSEQDYLPAKNDHELQKVFPKLELVWWFERW